MRAFFISRTMRNAEIIRNLSQTGKVSSVKIGEETTDSHLEEWELKKEDHFKHSINCLRPPHLRALLVSSFSQMK